MIDLKNMQYSPKLKKAMTEIKQILEKHDIGAAIVLHTPGFGEMFLRVDPSYSAAKIQDGELRLKASVQHDFKGDKSAWVKKMMDTMNLAEMLAVETGKASLLYYQMVDVIKGHMDIETKRDTSINPTPPKLII